MASLTLLALALCLLVGTYLSVQPTFADYYGSNPYSHTKHHVTPPPAPPPQTAYPSDNGDWLPATATWYGSATGAGSDGGACGYGELAASPYGTRVSAGSPVLFDGGLGCGACYQVKCLAGATCSAQPVMVIITDECPGGYCAAGRTHFDMGGAAFGDMASSPQATESLLDAGVVQVLYRRVPCSYAAGTMVSFQVNNGATDYWFSMLVRYVGGDGELSAVELMESGQWKQMEHLWGAYWCLNAGPLTGSFSVKLTTSSGATLTAADVIPASWAPGQTYSSNVNF